MEKNPRMGALVECFVRDTKTKKRMRKNMISQCRSEKRCIGEEGHFDYHDADPRTKECIGFIF